VAIVGKSTHRKPVETTANIAQWAKKTLKKRKGKERKEKERHRQAKRRG
jgi:hypothetical protein